MNDDKYFGLTPTQLNLAFLAVVGAVAIAGFVYVGGVGAVKEYLGGESTPPAAVTTAEPPVTEVAPSPSEPTPPCGNNFADESSPLPFYCTAIVTNTGKAGLNIRSGPSLGAAVLEVRRDGDLVTLLGGPVKADGYIWWETSSPSHWVAEGDGTTKWLTPTPECGPLQYYDPALGCIYQNVLSEPD